ncbi:MAG: exodeoxyribonuclease VII large subunit [Lachnospira sp.]
MAGVYTVTQINSYIKNMFRQDFVLNRISIQGEISNCKYHTSGHIYFTLKDDSGTLSAIMFSSSAAKLDFKLSDGMKVVVDGRIDIYERDGKYQLYASNVTPQGIGDLYKRFEALKEHYKEMGYFADEYKRPIPLYSRRIGIVTASTGAAIHDIINISHRRNPYVSLYLYPALVQGEQAKYSIVKGIEVLDKKGLDCIIVGRGGGSIEDLWAFNEEIVAEAIFAAKTPIISAVGHETDFTIADFVSDLRAPTPSAAAELAVCDIRQIESIITGYKDELYRQMCHTIDALRNISDKYSLKLKKCDPVVILNERRERLIHIDEILRHLMVNELNIAKNRLSKDSGKLSGLSPLNRLSQGYSYIENAENGENVKSVKNLKIDDELLIYMTDGNINARVTKV